MLNLFKQDQNNSFKIYHTFLKQFVEFRKQHLDGHMKNMRV